MSKDKKSTIDVQGTTISILTRQGEDYISLTDMVRNFDGGGALIEQWLKNKDTVLFLGVWERIYNPDFNSLEFEGIKNEAGRNSFFLSAKKWIELTGAKGLAASAGRYGGTYAHRDIAFEFGSWLSPEFKLYLIKEFQRLKEDENQRLSLAWNLNRTLSKLNYRIHTDAVKSHLIPVAVSASQAAIIYASEADMLNVALFGQTAKQWRDANPDIEGNMRDYATIEQLLVLANIEGMNAELIHMKLTQGDRLKRLNAIAIRQMLVLTAAPALKQLKE
ncbi:MAG: KilA-N domain-containing protein [Candidatus Nitrotoga sp.]